MYKRDFLITPAMHQILYSVRKCSLTIRHPSSG